MSGRSAFRVTLAAVTSAALMLLCGCGIPADPDRSLETITGGVLRVGASESAGLVDVDGDIVTGPLPTLIEGFADEHDARVRWSIDSEEKLVDALEAGDIDLAIGGMTDATAWADRVSVTRGYPSVEGSGGAPVVVLLPLGENGLQAALETYLDREVAP